MTLPAQTRIVVIGGGIVGASAAYHLGRLGLGNIVLLEQNEIGGGTTWHAAGMVTRLRTTAAMAAIHDHSARLYAALEAETGVATGWKQVGSLFLARTKDRVIQNRRAAAMARMFGIDSHEISLTDVHAIWPQMRTDDLAGALFIPGDGRTEPASTARALASGARLHGVDVREHVRVRGLLHDGNRVTGVITDQGEIRAETVLVCGGMWTRQFLQTYGIPVPLYPVEHHYAVTNPVPGVSDWLPCTRDHDGALYIRSEGAQLVVGAFQPGAKPWKVDEIPADFSFDLLEPDWDGFGKAIREATHRFPDFAGYGFDRFVNGPESFTPDSHTIVGPAVGCDRLYVCAGFNSFGIAGAGGMGKIIAEWIAGGEEPMDMWEVDSRRFAPWQSELPYLTERVSEALGHHYELAWPTTEFRSARDQRTTPFHPHFAAASAIFGQRLGWERPLVVPGPGYSGEFGGDWGRAPWFDAWRNEHLAARSSVGLFDLSSFGKLRIAGPDASRLLNWAAANEVDVSIGKIVYTALLTRHGRFASDVTITRTGADDFALMTAAVQPIHDRDWLERLARIMAAVVSITDVTADWAVLGVMGPQSRALLQTISDTDFGSAAFPFGTAQNVSIAGIPVRAQRITYVGELGWELHVAAAAGADLLTAVLNAGRKFDARLAGTMAMNSMRVEKAYVSWSHDVSRDDTPLEAGLGFAVAWDKPGGFLGREALIAQKQRGIAKRLIALVLDDPEPVLWGHEPILRDGEVTGFTSSGTYGHSVGGSVAMGYVTGPVGMTRKWVEAGTYEINVAGNRFAATPHWRAPFDPERTRIFA